MKIIHLITIVLLLFSCAHAVACILQVTCSLASGRKTPNLSSHATRIIEICFFKAKPRLGIFLGVENADLVNPRYKRGLVMENCKMPEA